MLDAVVQEQPSAMLPKPTLMRNKQFLLILIGYTMNVFGNSFHNIAINLWVLTVTGSAKMMSIMLITNLTVSSLCGSFAGTFADRFDRRKIMRVCDVLRCIGVLLIALCISIPNIPFLFIVFLSALVTFFGLFHSPAMNASLINIVGKSHIQRATGLMNISENIARTSGFVLGGMFVAALGGVWAIIFDGFAFLLSFVLISLAGAFPSPRREGTAQKRQFWSDMKEGFKYVYTDPFAKAVIVLSPVLLFFFMMCLMLTQVMAVQVWNVTAIEFGLIEACIPLGYMLGAGLIVWLGAKLKRRGLFIVGSLVIMGPAYIFLSFLSTATYAIPTILVIGFVFSFCSLLISIILRLEVSEELQGRVFGIMGSLNSIAPSIGLAIASIFADSFGVSLVVMIIGVLLSLFSIVALWAFKVIRQYN